MRKCPLLVLFTLLIAPASLATEIPTNARSTQALSRVQPALTAELKALGADWGAPLYLRIFKASDELEVWVDTGERYQRLRTWPICTWSGDLGPKLRQGDGQAPEGFYEVAAGQLNPVSRFHLSFNLGYPNAYDRAHGRTGDYLMVHGNCVSVGCYAMGDVAIEEIYSLVAAALAHGQRAVPVHAFPFRMDGDWEAQHADSEWLSFWRQLAPAWQAFERSGQPPRMRVVDREYRLHEG
ncbi:MAG: murein L,D-transpeptidase [Rhodanobacteraceae bacterium]|nr:murein L,D-transpeptidase [Rhodanobacteraceae bacterium]